MKPRLKGVAFSFEINLSKIAHFPSLAGLSYCGDE